MKACPALVICTATHCSEAFHTAVAENSQPNVIVSARSAPIECCTTELNYHSSQLSIPALSLITEQLRRFAPHNEMRKPDDRVILLKNQTILNIIARAVEAETSEGNALLDQVTSLAIFQNGIPSFDEPGTDEVLRLCLEHGNLDPNIQGTLRSILEVK